MYILVTSKARTSFALLISALQESLIIYSSIGRKVSRRDISSHLHLRHFSTLLIEVIRRSFFRIKPNGSFSVLPIFAFTGCKKAKGHAVGIIVTNSSDKFYTSRILDHWSLPPKLQLQLYFLYNSKKS